jgi:hypothetical protein
LCLAFIYIENEKTVIWQDFAVGFEQQTHWDQNDLLPWHSQQAWP